MSKLDKINLHNPILYGAIMAIGMFLGYKMRGSLRYNNNAQGNLSEIMELVKNNYVDEVRVDSIEGAAIDKLLSQLDPHSVYIPPKDLAVVDEDLDGHFDGIGVEFFIQRDTLLVTSVIANGPSAAAGLLSGDKIIQVNDSVIAGRKVSTETITKLLRGVSGSKVLVNILRGKKLFNKLSITRGTIPMHSVDASYMIDNTTGYLKINRYAATTYEEFVSSIKKMKTAGMKNLILDLRDNPGGYLEAANAILDEFIAGKKTLVYTKGRNKQQENYSTSTDGIFETGKIAVLINEGSASAAEITSGVLQDYDRATIIGRRSFGKGLVQEEYKLSNGGAIRLTIARYYIPSGRCIQKDYSKGMEHYDDDVDTRLHTGELFSADSIKAKDSTIYKTVGGRTVFGGGGITPDIFIPLDTLTYNAQLGEVLGSAIYSESVNDYIANNRENLKQFSTAKLFIEKFNIDDAFINELQQKCKANEISIAAFSKSKDIATLKKYIKANVAKSLFGADAQYQVRNVGDEFIAQALKSFAK
jgi:carboxyl-terminal processing protease